jgi:hypothetical protein
VDKPLDWLQNLPSTTTLLLNLLVLLISSILNNS